MSPKASQGKKRGGKDLAGNAPKAPAKGGKKAGAAVGQKGGRAKGKAVKAPAPNADGGEVDLNVWSTCTNDVRHVQNLLERCLRLYMSREEVIAHLQRSANIEPVFTQLVWERLEKDNPDFFEAYYIMVRMKDQIIRFNSLLETYKEDMQRNQTEEKTKKSSPAKRGGAAAATTGKRTKNAKVEEQPSTSHGLGNWEDVAGSPLGFGIAPPSGMFMNAAMNLTPPFPSAMPGLPKTPFSSGLELSADEMYQLMMTPSTLNTNSLAVSDLQTDFENHMRSVPGSEYRNHLPTDFNLDDIPDFSLTPH